MMLSTSWFGCVFDLEGVLIKSREKEHRESWMKLAKRHDHPPPPEMVLKHCDTMKPEDFIARQLQWTRDPMQMRRYNEERVEIFEDIVAESERRRRTSARRRAIPGAAPARQRADGGHGRQEAVLPAVRHAR